MLLNFNSPKGLIFPFYANESNTMSVGITDGGNFIKAHRRHICRPLANEEGIPPWRVSVGYGLVQGVVGFSVLGVKRLGLTPVIVLLALWSSAFFVFSTFIRRRVAQMS
jgi:hypothetical protein